MTRQRMPRLGMLGVTALLGLALAAGPALSAGTETPSTPAPSGGGGGGGGSSAGSGGMPSDSGGRGSRIKKNKTKAKQNKRQRRSEQEFYKGYAAGFRLIQAGQYEQAITAFRALKQDDHPDVANYIGYASRKLGRYADAQAWYERALRADPKHVRTWQYYGMWHVEQGNMLKAQDYLDRIRSLCGGETCKEFADLKGAMEGTVVY